MHLELIFAESALIKLAFTGELELLLLKLDLIQDRGLSLRRVQHLPLKASFMKMLIQQTLMLGTWLSDLL